MHELSDGEIQLIVISPPYFNAALDYEGAFRNYDGFLDLVIPLKSCSDLNV